MYTNVRERRKKNTIFRWLWGKSPGTTWLSPKPYLIGL